MKIGHPKDFWGGIMFAVIGLLFAVIAYGVKIGDSVLIPGYSMGVPARIFKPDAAVYRIVEETLGVPRAVVGFVSSNGWDAAGAKTFGLQAFWINRSGAPVERLGVRPDATLKSLAELVDLLG